jgi:hypothetical protein
MTKQVFDFVPDPLIVTDLGLFSKVLLTPAYSALAKHLPCKCGYLISHGGKCNGPSSRETICPVSGWTF